MDTGDFAILISFGPGKQSIDRDRLIAILEENQKHQEPKSSGLGRISAMLAAFKRHRGGILSGPDQQRLAAELDLLVKPIIRRVKSNLCDRLQELLIDGIASEPILVKAIDAFIERHPGLS